MLYYILDQKHCYHDPILVSGFDSYIPFIIVFIEKSKVGCLVSCNIGEKIAFILLYNLFDYLGSVKEDAVEL